MSRRRSFLPQAAVVVLLLAATAIWTGKAFPRIDPAELLLHRDLALVNDLHAVPESRLDRSDVPYQALEADRLDRCGLVGSPQRAVKSDMALDHARP